MAARSNSVPRNFDEIFELLTFAIPMSMTVKEAHE